MAGGRKIEPEELQKILAEHKRWIELDIKTRTAPGMEEGKADLSGADLSGAKLWGADLREADLSGANLSEADLAYSKLELANLREADLSRAKLWGAVLHGANLRGADLSGVQMFWADLRGADLREADLRSADLRSADLRRASLDGADLRGACLFNATLNGASLRGAAFDGASFRYTDFCNADLSEAKNLDQTLHFGPSTVGLDTLVRLRGNIPEPFLLGCGVPKRVIDSVLKAAGALEGIQRHSCFIYYADEDEAFARRLEKKLKLAGMSVYRAEEPKPPGYLMQGQISEAIDKCEKLIFVLSKASWEKHWVINDICRALKREREKKIEMLFPISLTPIEEIKRNLYHFVRDEGLARLIKEYCIPNYEDEKELEAGFERLLAGLRRSAERR